MVAVPEDLARCSQSMPMVRVLRTCMVLLPTKDLIRMTGGFYRATHCMGRRRVAAIMAVMPSARWSRSTPAAPAVRPCLVLLRLLLPILAMTEPHRPVVWFVWVIYLG